MVQAEYWWEVTAISQLAIIMADIWGTHSSWPQGQYIVGLVSVHYYTGIHLGGICIYIYGYSVHSIDTSTLLNLHIVPNYYGSTSAKEFIRQVRWSRHALGSGRELPATLSDNSWQCMLHGCFSTVLVTELHKWPRGTYTCICTQSSYPRYLPSQQWSSHICLLLHCTDLTEIVE